MHQFESPALPIVGRLLDLPVGWEDRTVFTSQAGSLTFAALRDSMLRIARWLKDKAGLRPGDRVALCLPKRLETVQLIHGVLAADAAYAPLPPQEPASRLRSILMAIDPRLLITVPQISHELAARWPKELLPPIRIMEPTTGGGGLDPLLSGVAPDDAIAPVGGEDLAAIFFTSGSTGEPKGVMWSQACLARTVAWAQERSAMSENDRLISLASLQYTTALDVFFPLGSGCSAHLLTDREAQFADRIVERSRQEGVDLAHGLLRDDFPRLEHWAGRAVEAGLPKALLSI